MEATNRKDQGVVEYFKKIKRTAGTTEELDSIQKRFLLGRKQSDSSESSSSTDNY